MLTRAQAKKLSKEDSNYEKECSFNPPMVSEKCIKQLKKQKGVVIIRENPPFLELQSPNLLLTLLPDIDPVVSFVYVHNLTQNCKEEVRDVFAAFETAARVADPMTVTIPHLNSPIQLSFQGTFRFLANACQAIARIQWSSLTKSFCISCKDIFGTTGSCFWQYKCDD